MMEELPKAFLAHASIGKIRKAWESDENRNQNIDLDLRKAVLTSYGSLSFEDAKKVYDFVVKLGQDGKISPNLPLFLLGDMFDASSLSKTMKLFTLIESNSALWNSSQFFPVVKTQILRLCNDILCRLSPSQHTVFYGRVLIFLAEVFPLLERSGLNVDSCFSTRASVCSGLDKVKDDRISLLLKEFSEFFKNCHLSHGVDEVSAIQNVENVLGFLSSVKLNFKSKQCLANKHFSPNYLLNSSLIDLQLQDLHFQLSVITQICLFMHHFKWQKQSNLSAAVDKSLKSICKSMFNHDGFFEFLQSVSSRELFWTKWKNKNCQPFGVSELPATDSSVVSMVGRSRKRKLGKEVVNGKRRKLMMGNAVLTGLWENNATLEACAANNRDFLPNLKEFFADASQEVFSATPDSITPKKYVNDGSWGWRALRLLGRTTPHFFTYGNHPIARLPDYLEQMIVKLFNQKDGKA